jgi:ComF family protein
MAVPFWSRIVDLIFPLECLACGREGAYCCGACLSRIRIEEKPVAHGRLPFAKVFAAAAYADPLVRRPIADWKLEGLICARDAVEGLVWRWHARSGRGLPEGLLAVPVPLHASKLRERGFDQAAEIARWLARLHGCKMRQALIRIRRTTPQTESEDRAANVGKAFAVPDPETVRGRDILLVDDVWTTGSTMGACARTLRAAGARKIYGFAVASAKARAL